MHYYVFFTLDLNGFSDAQGRSFYKYLSDVGIGRVLGLSTTWQYVLPVSDSLNVDVNFKAHLNNAFAYTKFESGDPMVNSSVSYGVIHSLVPARFDTI